MIEIEERKKRKGRRRKCGKGKESVEEGRKGGDKKFPVQILSPGKHAIPERPYSTLYVSQSNSIRTFLTPHGSKTL